MCSGWCGSGDGGAGRAGSRGVNRAAMARAGSAVAQSGLGTVRGSCRQWLVQAVQARTRAAVQGSATGEAGLRWLLENQSRLGGGGGGE